MQGYFSGGSGDFSVVLEPGNQYFYFIFSNYTGPLDEQGVSVARSAFSDRGQPGTVFKYFGGEWKEPGIDGRSTAIFGSSTGWRGPNVEAFWGPSVHWNSYLGRYVALLNHTAGEAFMQEGIYLTFSDDLLHWTQPRKALDGGGWYPQVLGIDPGETDSVGGRTLRYFEHGVSCYTLAFSTDGAP